MGLMGCLCVLYLLYIGSTVSDVIVCVCMRHESCVYVYIGFVFKVRKKAKISSAKVSSLHFFLLLCPLYGYPLYIVTVCLKPMPDFLQFITETSTCLGSN